MTNTQVPAPHFSAPSFQFPASAVDLAVIIVTWNVRDLALDALRTLHDDLTLSGLTATVWVVDNASTDGTAEAVRRAFPGVRVVSGETNLGFAGGNNLALRALGYIDTSADAPPVAFLLNPDTRINPGAVRALYDALMTLPRAGLVGARLTYGDGSFQHSAFASPGLGQIAVELLPTPGRLYESRLNGRYPREWYAGGASFRVDHTLGATMMVRRETIGQVGLLDAGFYMYCEEIDWQMRMRAAGWEIYCVPAAHVTHLGGQSTGQVRAASLVDLWRSRLRLYAKHYSPAKVALARLLIRLGMRRQMALARQRHAAGEISAEERDMLLQAYRTIRAL